MARRELTRFAWLSIAAALATIALKTGAYYLTGSVGLLSDAAESLVNLVAAVVALIALTVAARPPDEHHNYAYTKAEYLSAVVEGAMIFVAAVFIIFSAIERLLHPQEIENVGLALGISLIASVINGLVAVVLMRAGRKHRSITLRADGRHLMTDVWTSVGVVAAVLAVALTGWDRLDPIIALAVGLNIIIAGWALLKESVGGLLDRAVDEDTQAIIDSIVADFTVSGEIRIHAIRSRESGHYHFISMHVLVPGDWPVSRGHDLCERLEQRLESEIGSAEVFTHLEPLEDPRAYESELGVKLPDGIGD
ncbi:MAG TPA: cation diffusion facilitator family transporter [Marmoricola sp.]|nr:cation diffusion facilitator family transporter [Marmoricola sp.]HNO39281.1 cation diffusion facilitator family transporter [Marmoricola sp.]